MGAGTGRSSERRTRRDLIAAVVGGPIVGIAGCSSVRFGSSPETERRPVTPMPVPQSPIFDLVSFDAPDTAEIGEPVEYALTVRNTDQVPQTFEAVVRSRPIGTDRETRHRVSTLVPAGGTETVSVVEPPFAFVGRRREVTVDRFDAGPVTIRSAPRRRPVGEWSFDEEGVPPDRLRVRTDRIVRTDIGASGATASWLFASMGATVTDGTAAPAPALAEFSLITPDGPYDPAPPPEAVPSPLDGDAYERTSLDPNEHVAGWIAFPVPRRWSVLEVLLRWERSYDEGVVAVEWNQPRAEF